MHREFKELLTDAEGISEFVIAVFIDIRGFSAFSEKTESPNTAVFIKRVYATLIDKYFPNASFFKPTGDGLMVILGYKDKTLLEVSARTIRAALTCLNDFPKICEGEAMINFPVPQGIGIGIARDTACRIVSGDKTLDYSGRILNLAARLMNLARPFGVVIDGDFKLEIIPENERSRFKPVEVFLRGIAEEKPRLAYISETVTDIPKENLTRFGEAIWKTTEAKKTLSEWKKTQPRFAIELPKPSPLPSTLVVMAEFPKYRGGKPVGLTTELTLARGTHYSYDDQYGSRRVILFTDLIFKRIKNLAVPSTVIVTITCKYRTS